MMYNVRLVIAYDYAGPAAGGRHVVCAVPLDDGHTQRVVAGLLEIAPEPEERLDRRDFFGNRVTEFAIRAPHDSMRITMQGRVERLAIADMSGAAAMPADLPGLLSQHRDVGPSSPLHFVSPSARVPQNAAMTQFARDQIDPAMNSAEAAIAVGRGLHRRMTFDAKATTVDTPVAEAFQRRHGVCQDFSHIMIACLRGIGIPAGYVSGYLRTKPPEGKPRLEGADAMHAWVRAWCGPVAGWIEFDPTNNIPGGQDHIVVACGRDYSDVSPVKGSMRLYGRQISKQSVDVIPVA